MVELDQLAQRLQLNLKPRAVLVVEITKLNERVKGIASGREWPVRDHVKFRLRRAVAVAGQIVANIFDTLLEEVTLVELHGQAILLAHFGAALPIG